MTWVLYIKIAGIPGRVDQLIVYLRTNLKVRINETEHHVVKDLRPNIKDVKSKDWVKGQDPDMIAYTIRHEARAVLDTKDIVNFPMEKFNLKIKFEVTHFETID